MTSNLDIPRAKPSESFPESSRLTSWDRPKFRQRNDPGMHVGEAYGERIRFRVFFYQPDGDLFGILPLQIHHCPSTVTTSPILFSRAALS